MDSPMTAVERTVPDAPARAVTEVTPGQTDRPDGPIMTLRGAGVEVDGRRVGRFVVGVGLLALAVLAVALLVAGVQRNAQITQLRQHGVPVEVTVSQCEGLMGGSGSNLAGYACRGTFSLDGRRYDEALPGSTFHAPGAAVRVLTVPGDPALVATVGGLSTEHASAKVFVLPTILLAVLAFVVTALVLRCRRVGGQLGGV